eukprot:447481-Pelagomonas_calceolata.AAC.14
MKFPVKHSSPFTYILECIDALLACLLACLQSMNQNLPAQAPSAGQPFPEGAEHVVGGGADGEMFVQPPAGSPNNIMLSQHQLQQQQQQLQQEVSEDGVGAAGYGGLGQGCLIFVS